MALLEYLFFGLKQLNETLVTMGFKHNLSPLVSFHNHLIHQLGHID